MYLTADNTRDKRRYNLPVVNEIAVVFVGENGEPPSKRDLVIYPKNEKSKTISFLSPLIDPMVYPILFPKGELGWSPGMEHVKEKQTLKRINLTLDQYYSYKISIKEFFSPIFASGKLFLQYLVDGYVKVEANNLNFIKQNQRQLRVEMYQGLYDHVNSNDTIENCFEPGKVVLLPSSFSVIKSLYN
jgi:hypothetical protein